MTYIKAIYRKTDEDKVINNLLKLVLDEPTVEFLFIEERPNHVFCTFKDSELDKIKTDDEEINTFIQEIKDGKGHHCNVCGSMALNYMPYTYRDNSGCIGRSYECSDCRALENKQTSAIGKVHREKGHEQAVKYVEEIYAELNAS